MAKSARSERMRSRICAWTVTSSAVVGSSAMSSCGSHASAMAIMARWRIPPENACGYSSARRRASGIPTRSSISTARAMAAARETERCARTARAIWLPTVNAGLRLVIGSWKIIEIWSPRTRRISSSGSPTSSRPSKPIEPAATRPNPFGMRPITASDDTVLPEPLSPTNPSVSPRPMWKATSSTTGSQPFGPANSTRKPATESRQSSPLSCAGAGGMPALTRSSRSARGREHRAGRHPPG